MTPDPLFWYQATYLPAFLDCRDRGGLVRCWVHFCGRVAFLSNLYDARFTRTRALVPFPLAAVSLVCQIVCVV